jgi:hypothetical protein
MVWCLEYPISTLNQNSKHFIINLTLISGLLTEATSAGGAILRSSNRIMRKELGAGIIISRRNLSPRVPNHNKQRQRFSNSDLRFVWLRIDYRQVLMQTILSLGIRNMQISLLVKELSALKFVSPCIIIQFK